MSCAKWLASEDAYSAQVGDDIALMSQTNSSYYTMNSTGAFIWSLLQVPVEEADVVQSVSDKFEVDRMRCEQDVSAIFDKLKEAKLIKLVDMTLQIET